MELLGASSWFLRNVSRELVETKHRARRVLAWPFLRWKETQLQMNNNVSLPLLHLKQPSFHFQNERGRLWCPQLVSAVPKCPTWNTVSYQKVTVRCVGFHNNEIIFFFKVQFEFPFNVFNSCNKTLKKKNKSLDFDESSYILCSFLKIDQPWSLAPAFIVCQGLLSNCDQSKLRQAVFNSVSVLSMWYSPLLHLFQWLIFNVSSVSGAPRLRCSLLLSVVLLIKGMPHVPTNIWFNPSFIWCDD